MRYILKHKSMQNDCGIKHADIAQFQGNGEEVFKILYELDTKGYVSIKSRAKSMTETYSMVVDITKDGLDYFKVKLSTVFDWISRIVPIIISIIALIVSISK